MLSSAEREVVRAIEARKDVLYWEEIIVALYPDLGKRCIRKVMSDPEFVELREQILTEKRRFTELQKKFGPNYR